MTKPDPHRRGQTREFRHAHGGDVEHAARGAKGIGTGAYLDARPLQVRDRVVELFLSRKLPAGVGALLVLTGVHRDTPAPVVHLEIQRVAVGAGRTGGVTDSEHVDHERTPRRDVARGDADVAQSTQFHLGPPSCASGTSASPQLIGISIGAGDRRDEWRDHQCATTTRRAQLVAQVGKVGMPEGAHVVF